MENSSVKGCLRSSFSDLHSCSSFRRLAINLIILRTYFNKLILPLKIRAHYHHPHRIWYQLDWWLVWLPSCSLRPSSGGVTECGSWRRVARRRQGWRSRGIGNRTAHSTVYLCIVRSSSSALFLFSFSPHPVGTRAHRHFRRHFGRLSL